MKRLSLILFVALFTCLVSCSYTGQLAPPDDNLAAPTKTPDPLDGWRIEIGPPGNESVDVRAITKGKGSEAEYESKGKEGAAEKEALSKGEDGGDKAKGDPLPESVLSWKKVLAPDSTISATGPYGPELIYHVFENRHELYWLLTSRQSDLVWLQHTDKADGIDEAANAIVPKGRKVEIALDTLPVKMVESLSLLIPDLPPDQAWYADTLVGPRYIAKVGDAVLYATPGGSIRCGALISAGGLAETSADATLGPHLPESLKALLSPHRDRFDFQNRISQLQKSAGDVGNGFRFIAMGDSRSQKDLWEAITVHIDRLEPKPLFVINAGDVILNGTAEEFADYYIPPLLKTDTPYFIAIGNHDTGGGGKALAYKYLFGEQSLNYTFDLGKNRFIFLDNASQNRPWEEVLKMADQWLTETPKDYRKIVSAHMPPATIEKWAYHSKGTAGSKPFTDLMSKHQVDEVFLGHIHAYSTATLDGVPYTVTGGGGAGLHMNFGPLGSVHHYVICDVTPEGIKQQVVRFYRKEGGADEAQSK